MDIQLKVRMGVTQVKSMTAIIQQTSAQGLNGVSVIDSLRAREGLQVSRYELLVLDKEEEHCSEMVEPRGHQGETHSRAERTGSTKAGR